jgi:hypothetical protein
VRVQLRRGTSAAWALALLAAGTAPAGAWPLGEEQTAGSLLRIFTDSKQVAVRSWMGDYALELPRGAALALHWNNERVRIPAIDAAAGTQEAVDAITTASRPIAGDAYRDFVKVRNELTGELRRGGATVDYYLSAEKDYLGQQLGARYQRDLQDQHLNLSMGTSYGWDAIEPLADDDTDTAPDTKTTLHWNLVATRILSPVTLLRAGVELNFVQGLQHNPYRNVYAGGSVVPERHPDRRQRRDVFVKLNRHLRDRASLKLGYRFYNDDWGIDSHEIGSKLSQYLTRGLFVGYDYRYYTQTRADFHRDEYATVDGIGGYRSGDYRMGALSSHLFGVGLNVDLAHLAASPTLQRLGAWLSYQRYFNSNNYSANILETGLDFRFW